MNVKKTDLEIKTSREGNSWSLAYKGLSRPIFFTILQPSVTFTVSINIMNNTDVNNLVAKKCDLLTGNISLSTQYLLHVSVAHGPAPSSGRNMKQAKCMPLRLIPQ